MFRIPLPEPGKALEEASANLLKAMLERNRLAHEDAYRVAQNQLAQQEFTEKIPLLRAQTSEAQEKAAQLAYQRQQAMEDSGAIAPSPFTNVQPSKPSKNNETVTMSPNEQQDYFNKTFGAEGLPSNPVPGATVPSNPSPVLTENQTITENQPPEVPKGIDEQNFKKYRRSLAKSKYMGYGPEAHAIKDVDGKIIAITPDGVIPLVSTLSERDKELIKVDTDIVKGWNQNLSSAKTEIIPIINAVGRDISNPEFIKLKQNPIYLGHDMAWYESGNAGPEAARVVGDFKGHVGLLYSAFGQTYKGGFRIGIQDLISDLKPGERDSLYLMAGKQEAIDSLFKIRTQVESLANKFWRQNPKLSPDEALDLAIEKTNSVKIEDDVKKKYDQVAKEDKKIKENAEKTANVIRKRNKQRATGMSEVIGPNNERMEGPSNMVDKMLADPKYKGWRKA
jgi:hypothetical protein